MVRYAVANTRRVILVLVDFEDDYYSVNYQTIAMATTRPVSNSSTNK